MDARGVQQTDDLIQTTRPKVVQNRQTTVWSSTWSHQETGDNTHELQNINTIIQYEIKYINIKTKILKTLSNTKHVYIVLQIQSEISNISKRIEMRWFIVTVIFSVSFFFIVK